MKHTKDQITEAIQKADSFSDVCRLLGVSNNGHQLKRFRKFTIQNNISIEHFYKKRKKKNKECPVCGETFSLNYPEQITCSIACSNTHFRSGSNNPNWKENKKDYRSICFLHHNKKCVVCHENTIIEVHHFDGNRENNEPSNLIPLCPTHHQYMHSRYKYKIEEEVVKYHEQLIV